MQLKGKQKENSLKTLSNNEKRGEKMVFVDITVVS